MLGYRCSLGFVGMCLVVGVVYLWIPCDFCLSACGFVIFFNGVV